MINDLRAFIKFITKKKITPNQFVICHIIELKEVDIANMYEQEMGGFTKREYDDLKERGFIEDFNPVGEHRLGNLIVTPKFTEGVIIDEEDAFAQLVEVYPKKGTIEGRTYSMIRNYTQTELAYSKIIKKSKKKHEEILKKTIKMASLMHKGNIVYRAIDTYVNGRQWLELDEHIDDNDSYTEME